MKALRKWEKPILILSDVILINLAYMLAFYFRYNYRDFAFYFNSYKSIALIVTVIYIVCFYLFKLYGSLWSYASIDEFMLVIGSCLTANMVTIISTRLLGHRFAYGASVIACAFSIIFIVGFRMSYRVYGRFERIIDWNASKSEKKRVMIIGAGRSCSYGYKRNEK